MVDAFIECNLFGKGELATAAGLPVQTETATVVRAPLTKTAVWTWMIFGGIFSHRAVEFISFLLQLWQP